MTEKDRTLRAALEDALAAGATEVVERLSYARTSVEFRVDGSPAATLVLDRTPATVERPGEPAEITIMLDREHAALMTDGRLSLAALIAGGNVATTGPVRRYLEVDPIVRGLLADGRLGQIGPCAKAEGSAAVPRDLLAIETTKLRKSFGRTHVLRGVDLAVPEGLISVVLGPSGTGKSVLLQHIIGLLRPDEGDVLIRGKSLSGMSRSELLALRTEVGVMFQDGALFSAMSVYDNVAFPLRRHTDLDEHEIDEAVAKRLERVGLKEARDLMPSALSGGMRKRAGLARALVLEPRIVLCDEPDSGLDPVRTALLAETLIAQNAETGGTMVVITHDIALTRQVAQHMSILYQGQIVASGLADDVVNSEDPFVRQFLAGDAVGPLGMDA